MNIENLSKKEVKTLKLLSDNVRRGIPVSFIDALVVIDYQGRL